MAHVNAQLQIGHVSPPGELPALPTTGVTAHVRGPPVAHPTRNSRSGCREIQPNPAQVRRHGGIFADQMSMSTRRPS
jgi:hypothetical protein